MEHVIMNQKTIIFPSNRKERKDFAKAAKVIICLLPA
jgi:hypothetical protein